MCSLSALFVLSCALAVTLAEPRQHQQRRVMAAEHPYLFLSVPRGRNQGGNVLQGFEIVEEADDEPLPVLRRSMLTNDDDTDAADDDNDEDDMAQDADADDEDLAANLGLGFGRSGQLLLLNEAAARAVDEDVQMGMEDVDDEEDNMDDSDMSSAQLQQMKQLKQVLKTAKPTHMMVARDQAGALMVPDGIIEIEGQSVVDEKTGKAALLVPRAALDAIPDGSVVALMERSTDSARDLAEQERANRVIVRRRLRGSRRNVRRRNVRGGSQRRRRGGQRRRRSGNKRRGGNMRVIRAGSNNRVRGSGNIQRRRAGANARPIVLQG